MRTEQIRRGVDDQGIGAIDAQTLERSARLGLNMIRPPVAAASRDTQPERLRARQGRPQLSLRMREHVADVKNGKASAVRDTEDFTGLGLRRPSTGGSGLIKSKLGGG